MSVSVYPMKRCCLSCTNDGFRSDNVKEIMLRNGESGGISIALCDKCRKELYDQLKIEFE